MIANILPPELFSFLNEVNVIVGFLTFLSTALFFIWKKLFKERDIKIQPVKGFPKALKVAWWLSGLCLIASTILGAGIWNLRFYIDVNLYLLFALALSVPTAVFIPTYYSAIGDFKKYVFKDLKY
ncbi:hypothetical protein BCY89_17440 [Sphingobacterium siyangense]|uniref:Uncharacterized protein n=1 Tax=Sphingobacterium siyangense TaxID=459529 RepID=A0A420FG27_9SPHI|nr:hypothetical protein [Sphingobacterium siyangense]RKF31932.1 hypothetical protein BCY89_17440 [Sphingobacterium siyangense]